MSKVIQTAENFFNLSEQAQGEVFEKLHNSIMEGRQVMTCSELAEKLMQLSKENGDPEVKLSGFSIQSIGFEKEMKIGGFTLPPYVDIVG